MMGRLKSDQGQLFYEFRLGDAVPEDHLIRKIEAALDLSRLRSELARLPSAAVINAVKSVLGQTEIERGLYVRPTPERVKLLVKIPTHCAYCAGEPPKLG